MNTKSAVKTAIVLFGRFRFPSSGARVADVRSGVITSRLAAWVGSDCLDGD